MDNYKDGYFVLNGAKNKTPNSQYISKTNFSVTIEANHEILEVFLELIKSAKSYIKICSFILTDSTILRAIEDRLEKRDLVVFILTQLDQQKLRSNLLTLEEREQSYTHLDNIASLIELGAHVRAATNVHAKFMLADGEKGYLTSVNITTPSFTLNNEFCALLTNEIDMENLEYLFDLLYQKGTNYSSFISSGVGRQSIVATNLDWESLEQFLPSKDNSNLRYTFGNIEQNLYDEIINVIDRAEKEIIITTYSIVALNNLKELTSALKQFIDEKGGTVLIFCRGMNYRSDHLRNCYQLHKMGCKIWGDTYNHSKSIISDQGKEGLLFTANIDGKHGLKNGFEVGCYFGSDSQMIQHILAFANWQILNAPYIFSDSASPSDYKVFYDEYRSIKGFNLPSNMPSSSLNIVCEKSLEPNLLSEFSNYPLFFMPGNPKDNRFVITTGRNFFIEIELIENEYHFLDVLERRIFGAMYYLENGIKILNTTIDE